MKLIMENWKKYLNESAELEIDMKRYYLDGHRIGPGKYTNADVRFENDILPAAATEIANAKAGRADRSEMDFLEFKKAYSFLFGRGDIANDTRQLQDWWQHELHSEIKQIVRNNWQALSLIRYVASDDQPTAEEWNFVRELVFSNRYPKLFPSYAGTVYRGMGVDEEWLASHFSHDEIRELHSTRGIWTKIKGAITRKPKRTLNYSVPGRSWDNEEGFYESWSKSYTTAVEYGVNSIIWLGSDNLPVVLEAKANPKYKHRTFCDMKYFYNFPTISGEKHIKEVVQIGRSGDLSVDKIHIPYRALERMIKYYNRPRANFRKFTEVKRDSAI